MFFLYIYICLKTVTTFILKFIPPASKMVRPIPTHASIANVGGAS